jgi:GNAT superfamily N-acetyltransferase
LPNKEQHDNFAENPIMDIKLRPATDDDVVTLAKLHTAVADDLTNRFGRGPWSTQTSEKGVLFAMRTSQVYVADNGSDIHATLRLTTRKPWAIDTDYYASSRNPLYLLAMAVAPTFQRQGIGRHCLEEAKRLARAWPADAIRLDAFDASAGAGEFYSKCGFREVGRATYRESPLIYFELLL